MNLIQENQKKMKKKLTYFDVVNAVNIIKKRIDKQNKIRRSQNTPKEKLSLI